MIKKEYKKDLNQIWVYVDCDSEKWKVESQIDYMKEVQNFARANRNRRMSINSASLYVKKENTIEKTAKKLVSKYVLIANKQISENDNVVGVPAYHFSQLTLKKLTFVFIYYLYPEINLPDYKNLGIKMDKYEISADDIESQKTKILLNLDKNIKRKEVKDAIKKYDTVIFNFEGKIEGKTFEGGSAEDFELEIGSGLFIPGFEEQMIGLKINEEKNIDLKFPIDYHSKIHANKDVVFKVKIVKILRPDIPNVNLELLKKLNIPGVTNLENFTNYLQNLSKREKIEQVKQKFIKEIQEKIAAQMKVKIPDNLMLSEMNVIKKKFFDGLKNQDITYEEYKNATKSSEEKIDKEIKYEAEKEIKKSFAINEIGKTEKIEPSEEDYENEYKKYARNYQISLEYAKSYFSKEKIYPNIKVKKIFEFLMTQNDKENFEKMIKEEQKLNQEYLEVFLKQEDKLPENK